MFIIFYKVPKYLLELFYCIQILCVYWKQGSSFLRYRNNNSYGERALQENHTYRHCMVENIHSLPYYNKQHNGHIALTTSKRIKYVIGAHNFVVVDKWKNQWKYHSRSVALQCHLWFVKLRWPAFGEKGSHEGHLQNLSRRTSHTFCALLTRFSSGTLTPGRYLPFVM